jgi:hypothetical protein
MPSRTKRRSSPLIPRAKIWIEADGEYVFGHGLSEILKAIQQAGSIKGGGVTARLSPHPAKTPNALGVTLVEKFMARFSAAV